MAPDVTHIESQTVVLQSVIDSSHDATFNLYSSAISALQMFNRVSTVGFCHNEIVITERALTTQSNQHRGTERHQLNFVARRKLTFRHLKYFVNAPRTKPASERRDGAARV